MCRNLTQFRVTKQQETRRYLAESFEWCCICAGGACNHLSSGNDIEQHLTDSDGKRCGRLDLHLHLLVRMVLRPSRMANTKWNLPPGDTLRRAEYHRVHQLALHIPDCTELLVNVVLHEVGHLFVFCRLGGDHAVLYLLLHPGDEGYSNWGNGSSLDPALVLEALCPSLSPQYGRANERCEGQQAREWSKRNKWTPNLESTKAIKDYK